MAKTKKNRKKAQAANDNAAGLDMTSACQTEEEPADGYMYLSAPQHMARQDRQMAEAFDTLRTKSDLGMRLVNAAQKLNVRFVRQDFNKASTLGRTSGNTIALSSNNSLPEDITVLPHELMHNAVSLIMPHRIA